MSNPEPQTVAFQGERGAYSEQAALAVFGPDAAVVPLETFDEVFAAVQSGEVTRGIVPIENSLAGSIHRNLDLLLQHDLHIVAEYNLRVSHCLIAHPGTAIEDLCQVYSHPQALAQCEHSLRAMDGIQAIAAIDTAGSVLLIKEKGLRNAAAIASERAAEIYGMSVLARHFEDEKANYTRFLGLSPEPVQASGDCKTSIAFAGRNEPGLLFKCLSAFALRDIDLTKIESRPLRGVPWEYVFYLDFAGNLQEASCQNALNQLTEMASFLRVFGSYPRARSAWADPDAE